MDMDREPLELEDEVELPPDDGQELNFEDSPREFEEHTFEADFEDELNESDNSPEIEELTLLDDEDIDLLEINLEYDNWINEGGKPNEG